jgi:hypothetical protein
MSFPKKIIEKCKDSLNNAIYSKMIKKNEQLNAIFSVKLLIIKLLYFVIGKLV